MRAAQRARRCAGRCRAPGRCRGRCGRGAAPRACRTARRSRAARGSGSITPPEPRRIASVTDGEVGEQHRRRRAGDAGHVVVLGDPVAVVAERARPPARGRARRGGPGPGVGPRTDGREVEDGQRDGQGSAGSRQGATARGELLFRPDTVTGHMSTTDFNAFNKGIVDEFRANHGVVGGPFEGAPMILVTHKGAKSGVERTSPLVVHTGRRPGRDHRLDGWCAHPPGVVPQHQGQPAGAGRGGRRVLHRQRRDPHRGSRAPAALRSAGRAHAELQGVPGEDRPGDPGHRAHARPDGPSLHDGGAAGPAGAPPPARASGSASTTTSSPSPGRWSRCTPRIRRRSCSRRWRGCARPTRRRSSERSTTTCVLVRMMAMRRTIFTCAVADAAAAPAIQRGRGRRQRAQEAPRPARAAGGERRSGPLVGHDGGQDAGRGGGGRRSRGRRPHQGRPRAGDTRHAGPGHQARGAPPG